MTRALIRTSSGVLSVVLLVAFCSIAQENTEGRKRIRAIDALVGQWIVSVEARLSAKGPWENSRGRSDIARTTGSTILEEDFTGTREGRPFQAKCLLAVNNLTLKFQRIFADSEHGALIDNEFSVENMRMPATSTSWDVTGRAKYARISGGTVNNLTPPPVASFAAPSQDNARAEVINAEYHFAEMASTMNTKEAFLSHLASDGIVVQKGELVNGQEVWNGRTPNATLLSWYPTFVDAASSGDLALSTGPWEFRKTRQDSVASAFGQFVSVWKKQADGEWKVAIDIGISHAQPTSWETPLPRIVAEKKPDSQLEKPTAHSSVNSLVQLEKTLAGQYELEGHNALKKYLSGQARIFRPDSFPAIGAAAFTMVSSNKGLPFEPTYAFTMIDGEISGSGDWGFAYGNVVMTTQKGDKQEAVKAAYMRVWKKNSRGTWQVALEVIAL